MNYVPLTTPASLTASLVAPSSESFIPEAVVSYLQTAEWTDLSIIDASEYADWRDDFKGWTPEAQVEAARVIFDFFTQLHADPASVETFCWFLNQPKNRYSAEALGADLWLTRNGHGAGFQDRNFPPNLLSRLIEIAHDMGPTYVALNDRCEAYFE
jgi:hypothetical protein